MSEEDVQFLKTMPSELKILMLAAYLGLMLGVIGSIFVASVMGLIHIYIDNETTLTILFVIIIVICIYLFIDFLQALKAMGKR